MAGQPTGPDLPGYRYVGPAGSGGFSDVYLYEQEHPRLRVAVKLMKGESLDDGQLRQFTDEANAMADLAEHPFIVPVLGAGTAPDGRPYLVMRYYPPPDLGARVAAEPMPVPDALRTGIQLASAVETAHRSGIIHRDIKPSNVLISSYGVPGLSDFGIAGRGDAEDGTDQDLGVSMPWSPPEVLTGESNGTVTSDVYSLAATIWNLLVGRSPMVLPSGGDNSERALFTRILHARPPATGRADVPSSLDRLLQQAMSKLPAQRPQSALELARHLQRVEQELGLPRTEIVVLETVAEEPATLDLPPQATPGRLPDKSVRDDSGLTVMKAPKTIRSTGPRLAADVTVLKASAAIRPSATGSTGARNPASVAPEPEADPPPSRDRTLMIGGVAAVTLLVVALVVGVLLNRGDGEPPEALPEGPLPTAPSDVIPLDSPLGAPDIAVKTRNGNAIFTWSREEQEDEFVWQMWGDPASATPTKNPRVVVPLSSQEQTCIQVYVRRGSEGAQSSRVCAD